MTTHWIKVLTTKFDDLSSILRIYMVEEKNKLLQTVLYLHMLAMATPPHEK